MSSISDLVFLLLIFFIIMWTMVVNGEQVDLPQTKGVEPTAANTVTLTITEDLRFLVDNTELPKEQVELRLKAILESRADKHVVLNIDKPPTGETIERKYGENKWLESCSSYKGKNRRIAMDYLPTNHSKGVFVSSLIFHGLIAFFLIRLKCERPSIHPLEAWWLKWTSWPIGGIIRRNGRNGIGKPEYESNRFAKPRAECSYSYGKYNA